MSGPEELCPYCVRPFVDGGGATDEHVIGDAFGSSFTIDACRECNNTLGETVEGDVHRPNSVLDIIKWSIGDRSLRGTADLGGAKPADVIVEPDGRPRLAHPVVELKVKDGKLEGNLRFPEGTPREEMVAVVRKRLAREGMSPEAAAAAAETAIAQAANVSRAVDVTSAPTVDFAALRRHSAKVALAASVAAGMGVESPLADELRKKMTSADGAAGQTLSESSADGARNRVNSAGYAPPTQDDGRPAAQVTFIRHGTSTLVDVHLLGYPHLGGMFEVPAELPDEAGSQLVVVRETSEPLEVLRSAGHDPRRE